MTLWIGIAPGSAGAIVMLGNCGDPLLIQTPRPDPMLYSKALVACLEIAAHQHEGRISAAVSGPEACPAEHQGHRSAGWWEGALAGVHIHFRTLSPQVWQARLDGCGAIWERSLATARRLFPKLDLQDKDEGVAHALHVAGWLRTNSAAACSGFGVVGCDAPEGG